MLDSISTRLYILVKKAVLKEKDLTYQKDLQTKINEATIQLQQKIQELEEARRKESDMLDIMVHELRTPATAVKLNTELLTLYEQFITDPDKKLSYKQKIDRILENIDIEIKLINTLLSSAKLEGNKIELNREPLDIQNSIEMSIHAHNKKATEKGLSIVWTRDSKLPLIYTDKVRVQEITDNLIGNAVKYTKEGSITIKTKVLKDRSLLQVSIIDTGPGIEPEELSKLGQKFHRVDNYITSNCVDKKIVRPGGTGLGLYVVFGLVKAHGGKVFVESEVGKCSTFRFAIPISGHPIDIPKVKKSVNAFDLIKKKN